MSDPLPATTPAATGAAATGQPRPLAENRAVLDFLASRRSRPAKTLDHTAPSRPALAELLTLAARTPDHGKLEPWRFVVADRTAMTGLAAAAKARAEALGLDQEAAEKAVRNFTFGGAIVAVIASPKPSPKIPDWEQALSAGAVCLALVNAALAAGWGANWLTGPFARDPAFLEALGARPGEYAAGFIHIGRETAVPPDRPRPDIEAITTWL
ncbi:MAG: nitroreductase family protein [Pseudomonadota bacterium]